MPDPAVAKVVDAGGDGASAVLSRAEARMLELAGGFGELLGPYARDTINAGGKRLRPLLVCLASGVPVHPSDALVRAAAAVELIHSATLVHDDVLDDSDLRRGHPTVYARGGRLMATATGDLLFSRAFWELAGGESVEAVRVLSRASSALAAGELMQRADAWDTSITTERYLQRCRLKTAELFSAACQLGVLAAGGTPEDAQALGGFGDGIGLAFQLFDDVLDVAGPAERIGKPRGADLLDGTITLPLLVARSRDGGLAALDVRSVTDAAAAAEVCDRIGATGALEVVRDRALGLVRVAKTLLGGLPDPQRAALELVADGVVERYS